MASSSSFLSRLSLGGNGSPLLPLHSSNYRSRPSSNDYDLSDLSPRPSSPLLSPDAPHDVRYHQSLLREHHGDSSRRGKGKTVAYTDEEPQFPPVSVMDRNRLYRENRLASTERGRQANKEPWRSRGTPSWKPPSPSDFHDDDERMYGNEIGRRQAQNQNPSMSFMGFLKPTQSIMGQGPTAETDTTLRTIQRRERQIQKELQKLLDAQTAALERSRGGEPASNSNETSQAGSDTPRGTSRASSTTALSPHRAGFLSNHGNYMSPTVIPVRQPKPRPLTIRQVRNAITRSMAILADLKVEEDAYIDSALSLRRAALAKANKLSKQHKAIAADLRTLEKDDPLLRELKTMTDEYRKVCGDIELFEEKLKGLKHAKRQLESRIEEVRSERESGLSGYRGALKETERGIGEMMRNPGVKVLSAEGILQTDNSMPESALPKEEQSSAGLLDRRIGGQEFTRMRPERRTLSMARDWWEGEIALLESRREAVHREHTALEEGSLVWTHIAEVIVGYEKRLQAALNGLSYSGDETGTSFPKAERYRREEEELFRQQYRDLRLTISELEEQLHHAEEKGWNLLVVAISAELEGFLEGEKILFNVMNAKGFYIREESLGDELIEAWGDDQEHKDISVKEGKNHEETSTLDPKHNVEELTGSVVRKWEGRSGLSSPNTSSPPEEKKYEGIDRHEDKHHDQPRDLLSHDKEESDNEVPPGLLSEVSIDDSDNDIPEEFLSMHEEPDSQTDDGNEVPADLLAETKRGHEDVD